MRTVQAKDTVDQIEASSLSIGYPGHSPVLSGIDQQWHGPGIHLIIGENGSGKSTLIRTLAGLQPPLDGAVLWNTEDASRIAVPKKIRQMAFVESLPPRQSELTVDEALALNQKDDQNRELWLEKFGLEAQRFKSICDLSDGLAQRVMLVRAILQDTPWILMDEPTAFLDVKSRQVMWSNLSKLIDKGCHIMVASHDYHLLEGNFRLQSVTAIREKRLYALNPQGSFADWNSNI